MNNIPNMEAVWRVLVNGYPYKSYQEMGLESEYDAFMATKQAVYRVIDGEDENAYSAKDERGNKIVAKIKELVNIGRNGSQTYKSPVINISKTNNAGIDNKNSKYISQTFFLDSQVEMGNIRAILNANSVPEGSFIADVNNNPKTQFNKGDTFKILIPREKVKTDINAQVSVDGKTKTYPILYGKAPNSGLQNYLLTTDPFVMSSAKISMQYKPGFDLEIDKISSGDSKITGIEKGQGIDGTKFNVKSKDNTYNKDFITANGGKIIVQGLDIKEYVITEVEETDYFLKGKDTVVEINPKHDGDNKKIVMENTPVNIEVNVEKDSDKSEAQGKEIVTYSIDNIKNLSNVKLSNFTLTDNLPKEVRIKSLQTGTYNEDLKYSIYYSTNQKQNIKLQDNLSTKINNNIDFSKIKLADGEYITAYSLNFGTVKIGFANTSKMEVKTRVIEGLADKIKFINNVKVSGNYLEAKTEDKDDVPVTTYENILKVQKVSKEYNQYTDLPAKTKINATFDILDENKNFIETVATKDGEFEYKYLETGKVHYLKEISVDGYYVISKDLIPFKFEENGQVIELIVENDNVNLVVDVEKEAPTEAEKGEIITYDFNKIGNFSNTEVSNFTWGDKLPRQITIQKLQTGTWNEELTYKIQYITNQNTNWKDLGEFDTTQNNTIDFTQIVLTEGEYIKEYRFCFGKVKQGFTQVEAPKVMAKVREDIQNNKIFVNNTYVTANYLETEIKATDEAHTIIYTKEKIKDKELPKTGLN